MAETVNTDLDTPGGPQTRPNAPSTGVTSPGWGPEGPGVGAVTLPPPGPTDTGLPPGVHPGDPNTPPELAHLFTEHPDENTPTGHTPFGTPNAKAFPVNQRAARDWRGGVIVVNAANNGTSMVVGRRPGRSRLRLWAPTGVVVGGVFVTPGAGQGVLVAPTEGELNAGNGFVLNLGDPPVDMITEGGVIVGLIPGQVIGYCQYVDLFDTPEGAGVAGV